jgi:hypothetical protein
MAPREKPAGIVGSGKRICLWFDLDEAEALRERAYKERRSQSAVIREAVRKLLGIED